MRRWLRWNLRCRRGRRCAYLAVSDYELPEGVSVTFRVNYRCAVCRTPYRDEILITGDAAPIPLGRERVR